MSKRKIPSETSLLRAADDHADPAVRGRGAIHTDQPKLKTVARDRIRQLAEYAPATAAEFTEVHYPDGVVIILRHGAYILTIRPRPDAPNRRRD
jgi:hypothetical protein